MMNAVIILAAGASTRLGQPKQLVPYRGKSLLQHTVDEALAAGGGPVIVVLGAGFEMISKTIENVPVSVVENKDWQGGIGTSIRAGIRALGDIAPDADNVCLLLCDQPHVTRELLSEIQAVARQSGKGIVACAYGNTLGVPLLIDRKYFDALRALPDGSGAKLLMAAHPDDVTPVPFPDGIIDVDTADDLRRLEAAG